MQDERNWHFWIVAESEGKPYLIYGAPAREGEDSVRTKALEMLGGINFKIVKYRTRDLSKASALYRGVRLDKTHSLKESSKRIGHNKSLKRLKQQERFRNNIW